MTVLELSEVRERYLAEIERRLVASVASDELIDVAARYHLATGGKRLRALLPVWICGNLGGRSEDALDFGVGFELFHNATLVHDDLQDGDTHRRGQDVVWVRWGVPQAINVGDALFFRALSRITSAPRGASLVPAALDAMAAVICGQALEFQLQLPANDPSHLAATLASWERMAAGKTAALFAICMRAGVFAAGGDAAAEASAAAFGRHVGLLFQVQDDLLDLVGDKGRGERATDIAEGKISFPVAWAAEHGEAGRTARLLEIVRTPRGETSRAMMDEALDLLEQTGAIAATIDWIRSATAEAEANPLFGAVPGFVERILDPIRHVL
ncbi:MAG: polyprenyl synthetase family protein [Deltaproteobacteria bacterium]|nr:MAG: polyprenyl synthetase family protein [Deltaproteobacteria bacterium]